MHVVFPCLNSKNQYSMLQPDFENDINQWTSKEDPHILEAMAPDLQVSTLRLHPPMMKQYMVYELQQFHLQPPPLNSEAGIKWSSLHLRY